ncbi:nitrate ABC transporter substrate-binding protein [Bordetella genomosp. 1]|uniref:Nitrate ABC transporter substrate-binding protein n=1 Tax=Bordetella genomosp. 1 TaxID=1395607 RepID=A0A261SD83_9BORD|nr:ABC transporter substrate-binding protein [Bordetella genomosp. 1]OZI35368.1 nitrate ABC transporter substrate-binding protein [Bordetella genomosp. 1]OZI63913.1 nitrate ABC transporter substrate-binding protein [Bordetella genomosp. 1]
MQASRPSPRPARLTLALALALAAGGAQAADEFTVALAIPPAVHDGAPYAAAEALGYFKQENLDVKTIVFQGAGALLPQVANKRVTVGYPTSEPVISSTFNGKDALPLQYFYNGVPATTMEFAVLADGPIQSLADLKNKKIGVGALTWGTIPGGRAALRTAGLTPGKDVDFVAVGALAAGFQALRNHQVDALNFNSSWNDMLEMSGTRIRRIAYPPVFGETAGNGFIAHVDTVRDNPDLLVRFARAYTKGQVACDANPTYCVRAFWQQNPQAKPEGDEARALQDATTLLSRRLKRVLYTADGQPRVPGQYDLKAIQGGIQAMADAGEYPTAQVPVDKLFSNALLPRINDFDAAAVRAQAKAQQ